MVKCKTCQHYHEGVQLSKDTWTISVCSAIPLTELTEQNYNCKMHQHKDSLWDDAFLREQMDNIEFIKREEMTL